MDCTLPEIIQPLYPIRMLKSDIKEPERLNKIMTITKGFLKKIDLDSHQLLFHIFNKCETCFF